MDRGNWEDVQAEAEAWDALAAFLRALLVEVDRRRLALRYPDEMAA